MDWMVVSQNFLVIFRLRERVAHKLKRNKLIRPFRLAGRALIPHSSQTP